MIELFSLTTIEGVKYLPHIPIIKSSIKRAKIAEKKTLRNKMIKSSLKTAIKRFKAAVDEGNMDHAKALYMKTTSAIDKAVTKGTLHKNAANRKKAQLARYMNRAAQ
jgi:small subunit ribosomal protein S20